MVSGLVSDVSAGGAWINCWDAPPHGEWVTFTVRPDVTADAVEFQGQVVRALPDGNGTSIPGFGVRWVQARSSGSRAELRRFLSRLFGIDTLVWRRGEGLCAWTPGESLSLAETQQMAEKPVEGVRVTTGGHPRRTATVASTYRTDSEVGMRFRYDGTPAGEGEPLQRDYSYEPAGTGGYGSTPCTPPPIPEDARGCVSKDERGADVIHLVPTVGAERRDMVRLLADASVSFKHEGTMLKGRVTDINHQGVWVASGERRLPRIGDILAFRYPVDSTGFQVRLVGQVIRTSVDRSAGFAMELVRVDERGQLGAFQLHLSQLSPLG